ncbi:type II CAAX endopeptidase family protein [Ruminococcus sp.]|uniref:type II CAAX endopeptidase family protein n=1 Tax=Ruminococcus sp. TaxID=41978 RepID=UPI0025F5C8D3|nr:type II CAAX endopeptidase family protein [Ruminococcus sp.]MBQ8966371.1 CPBP family intramembrane metalloprotease [Ruminococcus sp.]
MENNNNPQYGTPVNGAPQYGAPMNGAPQYGTPVNGAPQYGTPMNGTPQYGAPMNNMAPGGQFAPPPMGYRPPPAPRTSTLRTVIIIVATIVLYFGIEWLFANLNAIFFKIPNTSYKLQFIGSIPVAAMLIIMVMAVMKKKHIFTAKGNGFFPGLLVGGYLIFGAVSSLFTQLFQHTDANGQPTYSAPESLTFGTEQIWLIIGVILSAGICEELMFRGVILNALRDRFGRDTFKGTLLAIIISGVMFGCMHFINLRAGVPLPNVLAQVVSVTGMGIFMGAVYCRSGNIKVCFFLHSFLDLCILLPNSMTTGNDLVSSLTQTITPAAFLGIFIYSGVTCYLLRKDVRYDLFTYDIT